MQKAKVKVLIALFAYSGNGGIPGTIPSLVWWVADNVGKMKADERIGPGNVGYLELCDTPITMTRNRAVEAAQKGGYDMLLMLDSDNEPDGYLGIDPQAVPFWETAFELAYTRLLQGKPTVAFAPYCGVPQHPTKPNLGELPYLFRWRNDSSSDDSSEQRRSLDTLSRNEAAQLRGIQSMDAGPTGVSLWTTNCFEGMPHPYFDYEWNREHSQKASTEDCFATRNAALWWSMKTGDNPLFALCDSWALHHKVKLVGRPTRCYVENIAGDFRDAIKQDASMFDEMRQVDFTENLKPPAPSDAELEKIIRAARFNTFGRDSETDGQPDSTIVPVPDVSGEEEPAEPQPIYEWNRLPITGRMINGRRINAVGDPQSEADLKATQQLAQSIGAQRVVLVHPWSGESAAALLDAIPDGKLYIVNQNGTGNPVAADQFGKALHEEFTAQRIGVVDGSILDSEPQDADLVFVNVTPQDKVTADLLDAWLKHVAPHGAIAGRGYSDQDEATQFAVLEFTDRYNVSPRVISGSSVWVVPKRMILASQAALASKEAVDVSRAGD